MIFQSRRVSKVFGSVAALDRVDFTLRARSIHILTGENGSGKSTLCNVLSGVVRPDDGGVAIDGRRLRIRGPGHALRLGICMVHQQPLLLQSLTVEQNLQVSLPRRPRRSLASMRSLIHEKCEKYGLAIDPEIPASELSLFEAQEVEFLRGLVLGARAFLFDEPGHVLLSRLHGVLPRLSSSGAAVLLVTHRLDHVVHVADEVSVMDGGRIREGFTSPEQPLAAARSQLNETNCAPADETCDLVLHNVPLSQLSTSQSWSARIERGRVLGIHCLDISVLDHVYRMFSGLSTPLTGRILWCGRDVTEANVAERIDLGWASLPIDAAVSAAIPGATIGENAIAGQHRDSSLVSRIGVFRLNEVKSWLNRVASRLRVQIIDPAAKLSTLSGGNIQRLLLGRCLVRSPKVLVLGMPFSGLDRQAAADTRREIRAAANTGATVIVLSTDAAELMDLADRVVRLPLMR